MKNIFSKGQSLLEYCVFTVLIVIALIASQVYIRRAIQGHWKAALDQVGEQYDYDTTAGTINMTIESNTISNVSLISSGSSGWLNRVDRTNTIETKTGFERVYGE